MPLGCGAVGSRGCARRSQGFEPVPGAVRAPRARLRCGGAPGCPVHGGAEPCQPLCVGSSFFGPEAHARPAGERHAYFQGVAQLAITPARQRCHGGACGCALRSWRRCETSTRRCAARRRRLRRSGGSWTRGRRSAGTASGWGCPRPLTSSGAGWRGCARRCARRPSRKVRTGYLKP